MYKPILKTHWLSSQNPLNVSLGGLKAIVFHPPAELLNCHFENTLAEIMLPPLGHIKTIQPDSEELQEIAYKRHLLSKDLFWTLFAGHEHPSLRQPSPHLKSLVNSIEFHFENEEVYSLTGIFRKKDIPQFMNPQFYLQDRSCNWERVLEEKHKEILSYLNLSNQYKKNEDTIKTWVVILEILYWSIARQNNTGDLQVLVREGKQNKGFGLNGLALSKNNHVSVTVRSEPKIKDMARVRFWLGSEPKADKQILTLNHFGELAQFYETNLENNQIDESDKEHLKSLDSKVLWHPWFVSYQTSSQVLLFLPKIEKFINQKNKIYFFNHRIISEKQFKPTLNIIESQGSLQLNVRFDVADIKLQHFNIPISYKEMIKPFMGGLDQYFQFDRKDAASSHMNFRSNDLLILRHQGMLLFCLLEIINWILNKPMTSGQKIEYVQDTNLAEYEKSFNQLILYFKKTLPSLLGKTGQVFDEIFSDNVRNYFIEFIDRLHLSIKNDRALYFVNSEIIEIKQIQHQILPIFRFILMQMVESTQTKLLTRSQSAVGEKFKSDLPSFFNAFISAEAENQFGTSVDIGLYNKFIISLMFELLDDDISVYFNGQPFLQNDNPFEILLAVSENNEGSHLFDLDPQVFFNGQRILSEELKFNFSANDVGFIEYKGQIYRIDKKQVPTLKSLQQFWDKLNKKKTGIKKSTFGEKVYQIDKSLALQMLMLRSQGVQVKASGEVKKIFDYFDTKLGLSEISISESTKQMMLPHQLKGAQWLNDLYQLKLGALLADEMGLGKTFQVLSFLTSLNLNKNLGQSLVVVPTSLVYNWVDEKNKFAKDLPIIIFNSASKEKVKKVLDSKEPVVVILTYGLLNENIEYFQNIKWNVVIFDEAQNLKNIISLRSVCARKLPALFKVCLTGTPMENNYLEFYSLCDLIVPGCLGDVDDFRKSYYNVEVKKDLLNELRLTSKPLVLRRTKEEVKLSLPVKTLQKIFLPFSESQKEIYKKMALTYSKQIDDLIVEKGESKMQIAMFAALMRLRQICSDPSAVPGVTFNEIPVKIEHVINSTLEHIENDESVIVFTQFISTLERLRGELGKNKIPHFVLHGKVSAKERIRIIDQFQNNKKPAVMLMTLKTGGVGLNLTKASVVYHLEPWWNPAVENQASDRAHRMGQKKDVKVYNLLIEGSLEERITDLKLKKQNSFDRLFNIDEKVTDELVESNQSLTKEDFLYLLKQ